MKPGHIYAINANEVHAVFNQRSVHYYCLILDSDFLAQNMLPPDKLRFETEIDSARAGVLFQDIVREILQPSTYQAACVRGLLLDLLVLLLRNFGKAPAEQEKHADIADGAIKRAVRYIKDHHTQKLTLDELSRIAGFSKYHFARMFKKATGMTVISYINLTRCKKAKALLQKDHCSVQQAAALCGFDNVSYFSKTFRELMGELPSEVTKK